MHIDENLSWSVHINNMCTNLAQILAAFWRMHQYLDFKTKMLYYNSYILPKLMYCINVWGPNASTVLLNKLHIIQKRAVRIVFNTCRDAHTSSLFLNARILNIHQLVLYNHAVLMFKVLNQMSPSYLYVFESVVEKGGRELRSATLNLLNVPHATHQHGFKAFRCSGARVWNSLPIYIRECTSINNFKKLCKDYIFSQM